MLFNSYSYEILYKQFHWIYLQGDVKLLLVTVNNSFKFEIEIVQDLSCHPITNCKHHKSFDTSRRILVHNTPLCLGMFAVQSRTNRYVEPLAGLSFRFLVLDLVFFISFHWSEVCEEHIETILCRHTSPHKHCTSTEWLRPKKFTKDWIRQKFTACWAWGQRSRGSLRSVGQKSSSTTR